MISFKQFLNKSLNKSLNNSLDEPLIEASVGTSRRQGITHLHAMKPVDFIEWLDEINKKTSGFLDQRTVSANLKVDGIGFRWGKSASGEVFIEGSRTGPIASVGAFSAYAQSKGSIEPILIRAAQYDEILDIIKKDTYKLLKYIPNNTKVYCELFFHKMREFEDDTGVQFVTVKYDRKKIGKVMTMTLYNVLEADTGQVHPDAQKIMDDLINKASSTDVRIVSSSLSFSDSIDIRGEIDLLKSLLGDKSETIRVLSSRKKVDKEKKTNLISLIDEVKQQLESKILFNPNICGQDRFCSVEDGEGLVLHTSRGIVKVISPKFRAAHGR